MLPIKQLQMLSNLCTECALVMLYDGEELKACRILGFQQFGSSDSVQFNMNDIIKITKDLGFTTVRLVHNHPHSEEPNPSMPDIITHAVMKKTLGEAGLTVLDSAVVASMKFKTYGGRR